MLDASLEPSEAAEAAEDPRRDRDRSRRAVERREMDRGEGDQHFVQKPRERARHRPAEERGSGERDAQRLADGRVVAVIGRRRLPSGVELGRERLRERKRQRHEPGEAERLTPAETDDREKPEHERDREISEGRYEDDPRHRSLARVATRLDEHALGHRERAACSGTVEREGAREREGTVREPRAERGERDHDER